MQAKGRSGAVAKPRTRGIPLSAGLGLIEFDIRLAACKERRGIAYDSIDDVAHGGDLANKAGGLAGNHSSNVKVPIARAAKYRVDSSSAWRMSSTSRPYQRSRCSLRKHLPVNGAGQTLRRRCRIQCSATFVARGGANAIFAASAPAASGVA